MELIGKDYKIENKRYGPYVIRWLTDNKNDVHEIILASESVSADSADSGQALNIISLKPREDDPKVYRVINNQSFSAQDILFEAISLNCQYYGFEYQKAEESILGFCNKYGLLFSRGYLYHKGTPYVCEDEKENYDFTYKNKNDCLFLSNFIISIGRLRALVAAYSICRNKGIDVESTSQDPLFILATLFTLLIPDERVIKMDNRQLISALCDMDYLDDFLYDTFKGMCCKSFGQGIHNRVDYEKHRKDSVLTAFLPTHIPANLHKRIHAYLEAHKDYLDVFFLDADLTISSKVELFTDTKEEKERIQFIRRRLEPRKNELISMVGYVASVVLNKHLSGLHMYLYPDESNFGTNTPFQMGYNCVTLYDQLMLEVAQLYLRNAGVRRCCRPGCKQLFSVDDSRSDKKYCSKDCIRMLKNAKATRGRSEETEKKNEEKNDNPDSQK